MLCFINQSTKKFVTFLTVKRYSNKRRDKHEGKMGGTIN